MTGSSQRSAFFAHDTCSRSERATELQRFDLRLANVLGGFLIPITICFPDVALSQSVFCVPPVVPTLPSDPQMRREFRPELSAEFSQYFTDAQDYLNCLHAAHGVTRLEIEQAIQDYTTLLNTPQNQN